MFSNSVQPRLISGSPTEQYTSFVQACLDEGKTTSHFDYAVLLAETGLLGTIAVRHPSKKLSWDTAKAQFENEPAAKALV